MNNKQPCSLNYFKYVLKLLLFWHRDLSAGKIRRCYRQEIVSYKYLFYHWAFVGALVFRADPNFSKHNAHLQGTQVSKVFYQNGSL